MESKVLPVSKVIKVPLVKQELLEHKVLQEQKVIRVTPVMPE